MVVVEDMRISGKRVFLLVAKRKSLCNEDGRIRVEEIEWIRGRFTQRFAEQITRLAAITTNTGAGWLLEELALERLEPVPQPRHMSVDEVARQELIVLDHFHIKKYLNDAVDTIRKQELRTIDSTA